MEPKLEAGNKGSVFSYFFYQFLALQFSSAKMLPPRGCEMGEKFSAVALPGNLNFDPETQMMIFFSGQMDDASTSIKAQSESILDAERQAALTQAEHRRLNAERNTILGRLRANDTPTNLNQINKVLRDILSNKNLTDERRQHARELLEEINSTQASPFANNRLPEADWQTLLQIAETYGRPESPLRENKRESILAWLSNNTGIKHGRPYIGSPTAEPAASPQDIEFVNGIRTLLNERRPTDASQPKQLDWASLSDALERLITDHFESLKPTEAVENIKVKALTLDLALQRFNTAASIASASAKTIHDLKKGISEKY